MNTHNTQKGFSLIESVVTIGTVGIVLMLMVGILNILALQNNTEYRQIAQGLLDEEIEALRSASFTDLENRAATPFIETAYPSGNWSVQASASAVSQPNVMTVDGSTNPSRAVVPIGSVEDGTFAASFRVHAAAPANWKAGLFFRYHDERNYYVLQAEPTSLSIKKVVENVESNVWSTSMTFNTNTWYRLALEATGTDLNVWVNSVLKTATPISDSTFAKGRFLLGSRDFTPLDIDSVEYTDSAVKAWNFDGNDEVIGFFPRGWRSIGPFRLPGGATSITITDAEVGFTDMKQATVTVSWQERGATRQLSNVVLIDQRTIEP